MLARDLSEIIDLLADVVVEGLLLLVLLDLVLLSFDLSVDDQGSGSELAVGLSFHFLDFEGVEEGSFGHGGHDHGFFLFDALATLFDLLHSLEE